MCYFFILKSESAKVFFSLHALLSFSLVTPTFPLYFIGWQKAPRDLTTKKKTDLGDRSRESGRFLLDLSA